MQTVLYVCTGNTCRSPMAEAIARHLILAGTDGIPKDVFVASAGVQAADGMPTTVETLRALHDLGIEHEGRSKKLTAQMIHKADAVFVMTASHQAMARSLVADSPEDMDKVVLLDPETDLEDPIGLGQEAYDSLAKQLARLIPGRLQDVLGSPSRKAAG